MSDLLSLETLAHYKARRKSLKNFPDSPGVYIFQDEENKPLYIGKAKNLKSRVSSYFIKGLTGKTKKMRQAATFLSFVVVNSELEALLLEAKLVNLYQPQYNSELKDDKHPLYIKITRDPYPLVTTARKIEQQEKPYAFYGPFPSSTTVYSVLRMLRRIFPYADHTVKKRACLRSQIGLCDPCPSFIESLEEGPEKEALQKQYKRNMRYIKGVLDGRIVWVKRRLQRKMAAYSKKEQYEKAQRIKEQIERLAYITQPIHAAEAYLTNPNFIEDIRKREIEILRALLEKAGLKTEELHRIECFDIAHTSGESPTASMVTFIDGIADKKLYRHFRIRQSKTRSDTDSLRETISRRAGRLSDWGRPDLIVVDGGKPQVSTFYDVLKGYDIPVVGLAKRYESLIVPYEVDGKKHYHEFRVPKGPALYLLQRMRDEAHRFARRYHHTLLKKALTSE